MSLIIVSCLVCVVASFFGLLMMRSEHNGAIVVINTPHEVSTNFSHTNSTGIFEGKEKKRIKISKQDRGALPFMTNAVPEMNQTIFEASLMAAISEGDIESVSSLIELKFRHEMSLDFVAVNGNTPVHLAAAKGNRYILELLIESGINVNALDSQGELALFNGCRSNSPVPLVELLLPHTSNVDLSNHVGETALHAAARKGIESTVTSLLERGADPNTLDRLGHSAMYWAIVTRHKEVAALLLRHGANPNLVSANKNLQNHWTPLQWASYFGETEVAQMLLAAGADATRKCRKDATTSLHLAAAKGHHQIAEMLLDAGEAVDVLDDERESPLLLASRTGHREVVRLLLARGAAVDRASKRRQTALHAACEALEFEIAEALLLKGANPNLFAEYGDSPLYQVVSREHLHLAQLLIANGADVNLANIDGYTPLDLAETREFEEVYQYLKANGAIAGKSRAKQ